MKIDETDDMQILGEFIAAWVKVEKDLSEINQNERYVSLSKILNQLRSEGKISDAQFVEFRDMQTMRNEVVHGGLSSKAAINRDTIRRVQNIGDILVNLVN